MHQHALVRMRFMLLVTALIASFTAANADPYPPYPPPLPIPCTGEACTTLAASLLDHNVLQHQNGTYFRISASNGNGAGLTLSTAPALEGPWVLGNAVFQNYSQLVGFNVTHQNDTQLWTPELHYNGSMYLLYYAIYDMDSTPGFEIRVATSLTMADNSWTDHGPLGIPEPPVYVIRAPNGTLLYHDQIYAKIDASVLSNYSTGLPSNQMTFGDQNAGLFGVQLNNSGLSATGTPVMYIQQEPRGFDGNTVRHSPNMTGLSYLIAMNKYVYHFYSTGSCCNPNATFNYWTGVCRSAATLPFVFYDKNGLPCAGNSNGTINNSGSTFLYGNNTADPNTGLWQVSGPGSMGIVKTSSGPVITYQYSNQSITSGGNKRFGHNYLNFTSDGWPYLSTAPRGNNIGL